MVKLTFAWVACQDDCPASRRDTLYTHSVDLCCCLERRHARFAGLEVFPLGVLRCGTPFTLKMLSMSRVVRSEVDTHAQNSSYGCASFCIKKALIQA